MQLLTPSNKKCACELRLWLISSVSPLVQIICCPLNEIMLLWLHISENATNDQPSTDIEDFIKTRSKDLYLIVVLLRTCQKIYAHLPHSFSRVSDVYIASDLGPCIWIPLPIDVFVLYHVGIGVNCSTLYCH